MTLLPHPTIMVEMEKMEEALEEVLRAIPASIRALAREAGLSHSTLVHARSGRDRLSPEAVARLAAALRRWSAECDRLADILERLASEESPELEGDHA